MLGEQIKYYRQHHNWSQSELAALLHISTSTIGMYEQNRRTPCLHIIIAMAQIFQITLDEFVGSALHISQKSSLEP